MIKNFIKLNRATLCGIALGVAAILAILTPEPAFGGGAAGPGNPVTGGGSNCYTKEYPSVWDTCVGGSWRFYFIETYPESGVARAVLARKGGNKVEIYYDLKNDQIEIPDAGVTKGGTISRCLKEGSVGYWKYGYDIYDPNTKNYNSFDYQAGLIEKGGLQNRFDNSNAQITQTTLKDVNLDNPTIRTNYIRTKLTHGATFSNHAMIRFWDAAADENGYIDGLSWEKDGTIGWFCSGMFEVQEGLISSLSNVRIDGESLQHTNWQDRTTANASLSTAKEVGENFQLFFSHNMKFDGKLPNPDIKKEWVSSFTISNPAGAVLKINGVPFTTASEVKPNLNRNPFMPTISGEGLPVWQSHSYDVKIESISGTRAQVTVCEEISYQNRRYDANSDKGTTWTTADGDKEPKSWSRACANIDIVPKDEEGGPTISVSVVSSKVIQRVLHCKVCSSAKFFYQINITLASVNI